MGDLVCTALKEGVNVILFLTEVTEQSYAHTNCVDPDQTAPLRAGSECSSKSRIRLLL